MKLKKITIKALLAFIILVSLNCENDNSTTDAQATSQKEKINDAEKWFNGYKSKSSTNKSKEAHFNKAFVNIDYYWENATVIPLDNNATGIAVPIRDNPEDPDYKGQKMLYLYPADSGYQSVIQEIFPDSETVIDANEKKEGFANLKSFSGYVITWDLKKGFLKGVRFENNIITEVVKDVKMVFDEDVKTKGNGTGKMAPMFDEGYGDEREVVIKGGAGSTPLNNVIAVKKSPAISTPTPRSDYSIGGSFGGDSGFKGYVNTPTGGGSGITAPTPEAIVDAIQKQINADKLPACLKKILDDLVKTNAGPGNVIVKFAGDKATGYNWTMLQGANNLGVSGNTLSTYNETTGITTTFDIVQYPNATDLGWAKTMLHESIHAYLTTYYKLQAPGYIAEYPKLFQDWCANGNKDLNKYQHEEIARNLVKSFGDALQSYGISQGYNLNEQFYQDMAWGGLLEIDAFKDLPQADRIRISNTINIEMSGMDDLGNKKPQKGKKAGC